MTYPDVAGSVAVKVPALTNTTSLCLFSQKQRKATIKVAVKPLTVAAVAPVPLALTNTRADIPCHTDSVHVEYWFDAKL